VNDSPAKRAKVTHFVDHDCVWLDTTDARQARPYLFIPGRKDKYHNRPAYLLLVVARLGIDVDKFIRPDDAVM